jgi:hypothetical protein
MPENERIIRELYRRAEVQDSAGFAAMFSPSGYFYDVSAGQKYTGAAIGDIVGIYATAFPDMHRELEQVVMMGDVVLVQLSLNGTHQGPLVLPAGTIDATGQKILAPCCDVFRLRAGMVDSFDCYTAATIMFAQLGVLSNLSAVLHS